MERLHAPADFGFHIELKGGRHIAADFHGRVDVALLRARDEFFGNLLHAPARERAAALVGIPAAAGEGGEQEQQQGFFHGKVGTAGR